MKIQFFLFLFVLLIFSACSKNNKQENCITDLIIGETTTPSVSTVSAGITSSVKAYGPNLCYSFREVEIKESSEKVFDIRIKGNMPCYPTVCLDAVYEVNPIVKIITPSSGIYILRFYNNNFIFKSDTVAVN